MHACIGDTGQLERSDENLVRSSGTGVTGSYEPPNMGAGVEIRLYTRAVSTLNCRAINLVP